MNSKFKNGFLIKKNTLKKSSIDSFFLTFLEVCKFYASDFFEEKKKFKNWDDVELSKILIKLRAEKPKVFSKIYDVIQKTPNIFNIANENYFDLLASKFLEISRDNLYIFSSFLRMDPPNDKKNSLGWHQDDHLNKNKNNDACTIWCPLINVHESNGALKVLTGSHINNFPLKLEFAPEIIKSYKEESLIMKAGDVMLMNNLLIHKSGDNVSDNIRFTLVYTYNTLPVL